MDSINRLKALAYNDIEIFVPMISPHYSVPRHLKPLTNVLNRIIKGEQNIKVLLSVPPRHAKTETILHSIALYLLRNPTKTVGYVSYAQRQSESKTLKAQRYCLKSGVIPDEKMQNRDEWRNKVGGGIITTSIGGALTGQGVDLLIVDDPVKNKQEAESSLTRKKQWEWWEDVAETRLEPGASVIVVMTRWHEDDLAGRILTSEDAKNWTVVRLPAFAESQTERDLFAEKYNLPIGENDPLNRKEGDPLCSERYDSELLESIKIVLGSYAFGALYQQTPSEPEGSIFKVEKIDIVKDYPRNAKLIRYWDKAGTKDGGAYTAGGLMARDNDGIFYICDMVRGQWSANEREKTMKQVADMDGNNVQIWVEQEPGSGGLESADSTIKNLAGFIVRKDKVTGSKETRWEPLSAQVEAGNVKMVYGSWNKKMIDELRALPSGKYKDQADSLAGAFNKLAKFRVIEAGGSFQLRT